MSSLSDHTYLVPRQVTTRFEFVPGWGLPEALGLGIGLAVSYGVYTVASGLGMPAQPLTVITALPTAAAVAITKGYQQLTRGLLFHMSQKRFQYRSGTGKAKWSLPQAGPLGKNPLLSILLSLLPFHKAAKKSAAKPVPVQTAQDWFPITDVRDGVLHRKDGQLAMAIRIMPLNLGLKSQTEQVRIMGSVHEAINALQHPAQILSIARPLDLDEYVRRLDARMADLDVGRQRLMKPYIRYVAGLVAGGEAQERRFYIVLPQPSGKGSAEELRLRAVDLVTRLAQADLNAEVLEDAELMDLLHVWSHPLTAAFERSPLGPPAAAPLLEVK